MSGECDFVLFRVSTRKELCFSSGLQHSRAYLMNQEIEKDVQIYLTSFYLAYI